jgi:hypothetical protein
MMLDHELAAGAASIWMIYSKLNFVPRSVGVKLMFPLVPSKWSPAPSLALIRCVMISELELPLL